MSLDTGMKIHFIKWEQLPITEIVIDSVNNLTKKQILMPNNTPIFEWTPRLVVDIEEEG